MELTEICRSFGLEGNPDIVPVGTGHINETYRVSCGGEYILQSLNTDVFREPETVEKNISLITATFEKSGSERVTVPEWLTADGGLFVRDGGNVWRMYLCAEAEEFPEDSDRLAGYAFGAFIRIMNGQKKRFVCAVDGYHDFERYFSRLKHFERSVSPLTVRRISSLAETLADVFEVVPKRNIHGDAKTDNVITGRICTVIDLDTAMEGYAALDFGDLIRSVCRNGVLDLGRIREASAGFAAGTGGILSREEIDSLYYGILWSTGELAVRYLNDAASGDRYFRNRTPAECLRRADELLGQLSAFINAGDDITGIIYSSFADAPAVNG